MRHVTNCFLIIILAIGLAGCDSRTDRTDGGGVLLSVSDFDGLPLLVGVNSTLSEGGLVQIETLTIQNISKNPTGNTSDLMNVEIQSYEVKYSRADRGTRVPTPFVRGIFGVAPVDGTLDYDNLPIMSSDQLNQEPLSDLKFSNGGFDKETGESKIVMNFSVRFFGRTLSGDTVETAPIFFTIEFIP
jgi:hypothetical protein